MIHEENNSIESLAYTIIDMSIAYRNMGEHKSALECALKAIDMGRKHNLDKLEIYAQYCWFRLLLAWQL